MILATRCPACGTAFRVVEDQLRASEGWVRCGRCEEVFNGRDDLFEVDAAASPPADADFAASALAAGPTDTVDLDLPDLDPEAAQWPAVQWPAGSDEAENPVANPFAEPFDPQAQPLLAPAAPQPPSAPSLRPASVDLSIPALAGARLGGDALGQPAVVTRRSGTAQGPALIGTPATSAPPTPTNAPEPLMPHEPPPSGAPVFVTVADDQATWRHGPTRRWTQRAALLLAVLLAAQTAYAMRNSLLLRWPQAAAAASAVCERLGCTMAAPRLLDALSVDSASLTREPAPGANRLDVTLRNRAATAVALPAFELSLSDEQNTVIARRVFLPAELGVADAIRPGADLAVHLPLTIKLPKTAGFAVEIFYP
jgi:predicted Zn finger-like uncharacterized protein